MTQLPDTGPRAVVKFNKSTTSGKEGYEVQYEHPDASEALRVALDLRRQCADALEPKPLSEQLEESIHALK